MKQERQENQQIARITPKKLELYSNREDSRGFFLQFIRYRYRRMIISAMRELGIESEKDRVNTPKTIN